MRLFSRSGFRVGETHHLTTLFCLFYSSLPSNPVILVEGCLLAVRSLQTAPKRATCVMTQTTVTRFPSFSRTPLMSESQDAIKLAIPSPQWPKGRPVGSLDRLVDVTLPWNSHHDCHHGQLRVDSPMMPIRALFSFGGQLVPIRYSSSFTPLFGRRNNDAQPPLDDFSTCWTNICHHHWRRISPGTYCLAQAESQLCCRYRARLPEGRSSDI